MKVLVVTSTRADWSLLKPVVDALTENSNFDVSVVATGQHLLGDRSSLAEIIDDGNNIDYLLDMKIVSDDSFIAASRSVGNLINEMSLVFQKCNPDLLILLGDRFEILGVALTSVIAGIPIAHLFGGDITEGAIDDSIRHAITKLSSIHFPSNCESAKRIIQMGEMPCRVHNVGSSGIDRILAIDTLKRCEFFKSIGLEPQRKNFIITVHPETIAKGGLKLTSQLLKALDQFPDVGLIFTGSNTDPGAFTIQKVIKNYVSLRKNCVFHESLGAKKYFSALRHCDLVIGNSSSGILEAPSFSIATVNIGNRQLGRIKGPSIIDCLPEHTSIVNAINLGLNLNFHYIKSPFGDGHASERIARILSKINDPKALLRKKFKEIKNGQM